MVLKYVKSDRGIYKLHVLPRKTNGKKTFWKCSLYKKYKCGGRVHVENDEFVKS